MTCSIAGCTRTARTLGAWTWGHTQKGRCLGLCTLHYQRYRRTGDPLKVMTAPKGSGCINSDGYHVAKIQGKHVKMHRVAMEKILGRPLLPEEAVHHKNGSRSDNRPENLELWSRSQPPGQRVEDKIAWAKELLALYEPAAEWIGACG